MRRREFPAINDQGQPDLSRVPTVSGAPAIESIDRTQAGPGEIVRLRGVNLRGAEVLIGEHSARVVETGDGAISVSVPELSPGDHGIAVQNAFGQRRWSGTITLLSRPNRVTYRGDAVGWHVAGGHSIVPKKKDQPILVLISQAPDVGLPTGKSSTAVRNELTAKLDGATSSVNAFWKEATYGETSFKFTVHPTIETLPKNLASYFQASRARRLAGGGAVFPVNWAGGESLSILSDQGTVTVTFTAGPMTAHAVAGTITAAARAAAADPTKPAFLATVAGGQIWLEIHPAGSSGGSGRDGRNGAGAAWPDCGADDGDGGARPRR